jgi:drug/metabolite transporter (DMT)-like permease
VPHWSDMPVLALVGFTSALGGFFISYAYRNSEAALVAPFEYVAMPLAIFWGILIFGEWPDWVSLAGIALILGSGLYMIWRENAAKAASVPETPRYRR